MKSIVEMQSTYTHKLNPLKQDKWKEELHVEEICVQGGKI